MLGSCQHCGNQLAVGAVACFRCGRMVARADDKGTGASAIVAATHLGTVAKSQLLENQWRLVKLLGQGAVGEVWQAHDVTLDRSVAVKMMHASVARDPAQVARFERESRVLACLEHPNLLPVLGIGTADGRPFLVTRLLEGKTLGELMHQRGGKLTPAETARVLSPICDALDCLHTANVVHRDLKPSNVFVGDDQRVTLMDLGSASEAGSELTSFGQVLGSTGYLSPEQKAGKRALDGKSDVYALGCLLIEVLTGKAARSEPSTMPGVPRPLIELARFAMAPSSGERPSAIEFRARLVPYLANEDVTAPMGSPLPAEKPTQHVLFTPTTGSPEYPHLRAVASPEPQTKEAPAGPRPSGPARTSGTHRSSETKRISGTHRISGTRVPPPATVKLAPLVPEAPSGSQSAVTIAPARSQKPSRGQLAIAAMLGLALLGAVGVGLSEQPVEAPPPMRVDTPYVAAPIQRDELKIVQIEAAPADRIVYVPNLEERKTDFNALGLDRAKVRKPNRSPVKPGILRVTTVIGELVVPAVMWIKRNPKDNGYELVGRTPVEIEVRPGMMPIRLQYEDDPPILLDYRVFDRKDWARVPGGMRLEIEVRESDPPEETVSRGENVAQNVSRPAAAAPAPSEKPMTRPQRRGGR